MRLGAASLVLLAAPVAAGCGHEGIQGSGRILSQDRTVAAVHQIVVAGIAEVEIAPGDAAVQVTTDDNLLPYVVTRVDGDVLRIAEEDANGNPVSLSPTKGLRVRVAMPEAPTSLAVQGSGSIAWDGSAAHTGGTLHLDLSGSGSLDVGADVDEVDVSLEGSGPMLLHGTAGHGDVAIAGSGSVAAFALALSTAHASVSGSGAIELSVSDALVAEISGSGSITYQGSPVVTSSVTGSGSIEPR